MDSKCEPLSDAARIADLTYRLETALDAVANLTNAVKIINDNLEAVAVAALEHSKKIALLQDEVASLRERVIRSKS